MISHRFYHGPTQCPPLVPTFLMQNRITIFLLEYILVNQHKWSQNSCLMYKVIQSVCILKWKRIEGPTMLLHNDKVICISAFVKDSQVSTPNHTFHDNRFCVFLLPLSPKRYASHLFKCNKATSKHITLSAVTMS